ncbi:MAG: sulfatase-like hydrolase/transferase [Acidobacteria bacterium]|nr:sulfatase-like hydrolase/transferase [Acidobacteriota bacterium]
MLLVPQSRSPQVPTPRAPRALRGRTAFAVFVAAALALPAAQRQRPDILLITLDTTRADRMGFLGSTRGLTPSLDAFARTATVFTRAYAQAPITTVSHATILTGTYPPTHGVDELGAPLGASVPYVPDVLRRSGYRTGAFVGSLVLDPKNGTAPGFERGFDRYDAGFRLRRPGENRYQTVERRGADVVARALAWRPEVRDAPVFLWVHLFDPHDPYDPPAQNSTRTALAPYDAEIAEVDRLVSSVIAAAGTNTLVAIAADHGEALGEHGEATHGVFLYEETLHVPLVIRFPEGRGAAARVTTRVRLADVAPTILEAVGIAVPRDMQGESLRPLLAAGQADRPVYSESAYPRQAFGWSPLASWRADRFLLVKAPRRELYDLAADPSAAHDLAAARARVADGMDGELAAFLRAAGTGGAGRAESARNVDPAIAERLAALGYVGGSGSVPMTGVDPKDRIAIANTLHDAIVAVEDGAFARAIPLLEKVTAAEPAIPIAQLNLGVAYARQHKAARAVPPLTRAVALQPADMRAQYELASALYETGDLKAAAAHFAVVAAALPESADARYSLGSVYARIDRVDDALAELHAAIALEPRHFRANLLVGRILTLRGDKASAVPYLQTAVSIDPSSAEAKQFLADALKR